MEEAASLVAEEYRFKDNDGGDSRLCRKDSPLEVPSQNIAGPENAIETGELNGRARDDDTAKFLSEDQHDATTPDPTASHFVVAVHDESMGSPYRPSNENGGATAEDRHRKAAEFLEKRSNRKVKRGRGVKLVDDESLVNVGLTLPANQYEAVLVRRAIRKPRDEASVDKALIKLSDVEGLDIYGDTSLGMKLSVVGNKVIVQSVIPLIDGRASPAQMVGSIKRGDVLLAINGVSLVNVPIDSMMRRLGPLSSPDANGNCSRRLALRLEAGGGIGVLVRNEAVDKEKAHFGRDPANDIFRMFPMVDQLSGAPLFQDEGFALSTHLAAPLPEKNVLSISNTNKRRTSVDEEISLALAAAKQRERSEAMSEFFTWSKNRARLLRCDSSVQSTRSIQSADMSLTKEQYIQRGQRAIIGAGALATQIETVDRGMDMRSFHSWNTTLSLYSRASTRRRFILDASASLPLHFRRVVEEEKEDVEGSIKGGSLASNASVEGDQLDADELLVRLAAHDEIWRNQVIEFLQSIIDGGLQGEETEEVGGKGDAAEDEAARASFFSSFLLGENMTKIITHRKKSQALPPGDVTAVLFDLTTKLSASVPDEIAAAGIVSFKSAIAPPVTKKAPGNQVMLATRFLVDEALPVWAKTFKPLPWDQRRVLWPLEKQGVSGSSAASTVSDDDSLTVDSFNTGFTSGATRQKSRRNLREQIEDQELDSETREEACFLLTYFFTQALLPKLGGGRTEAVDEIKGFVRRFGAYLRLHSCLAYSVALRSEPVIEIFLDLSRHDPKHREVGG
jgi:hypothetical protein